MYMKRLKKLIKLLYIKNNLILNNKTNNLLYNMKYIIDATERFFKLIKDNKLEISAGYQADHTRSDSIGAEEDDNIRIRAIYKEIIIIRADGSRTNYSKWDKVTILF